MHAPALRLARLKSACSSCNLRELCLPVGLTPEQVGRLDELVAARRTIERGQTLFRTGDSFQERSVIPVRFVPMTGEIERQRN